MSYALTDDFAAFVSSFVPHVHQVSFHIRSAQAEPYAEAEWDATERAYDDAWQRWATGESRWFDGPMSAPCPYRVREFDAEECNRHNCTMTAFEVVNAEALYRNEITIETEIDQRDASHREVTQDRTLISRLINAFWLIVG